MLARWRAEIEAGLQVGRLSRTGRQVTLWSRDLSLAPCALPASKTARCRERSAIVLVNDLVAAQA
jgi:hypothetical protein